MPFICSIFILSSSVMIFASLTFDKSSPSLKLPGFAEKSYEGIFYSSFGAKNVSCYLISSTLLRSCSVTTQAPWTDDKFSLKPEIIGVFKFSFTAS